MRNHTSIPTAALALVLVLSGAVACDDADRDVQIAAADGLPVETPGSVLASDPPLDARVPQTDTAIGQVVTQDVAPPPGPPPGYDLGYGGNQEGYLDENGDYVEGPPPGALGGRVDPRLDPSVDEVAVGNAGEIRIGRSARDDDEPLVGVAGSAPPPRPPSATGSTTGTIPAGSSFDVEMVDTVPAGARPGSPVVTRVTRAVSLGDRVAIPVGTEIRAVVGATGGLEARTIRFPDGRSSSLSGSMDGAAGATAGASVRLTLVGPLQVRLGT
jgi:hypothetical protein